MPIAMEGTSDPKKFGDRFNNVLVSSTGLIGKRLPIELIEDAVPKLVKALSKKGSIRFWFRLHSHSK